MPDAAQPRLRRWVPPLLILVVDLALALAYFHSAWAHPRTMWVGFQGDSEEFIWFAGWAPFALVHGHDPLLTTYLSAPQGVNLMWNTSVTLPALLLTPITLTLGPILAYNLLMTLGIGVSAWTASVAFHRFVPSWPAAFIGGLMYGFSPYMVAQATGHLMLVLAMLPPLLLLLLDEIFVRQRMSAIVAGGLLGVLVFAQLLTSEELLAEEALMGVIALVLLVLLRPREAVASAARAARAIGSGAVVAAVLCAFPLYIQFRGPQRLSGAALHPLGTYVNDMLNTVVPTDQHFATQQAAEIAAKFTGNGSEWNGYIGVPLIILVAVVAVMHRRWLLVQLAVLLGVVATVLSWGSPGHVDGVLLPFTFPAAVLHRLPLLNQIQAARLSLFADLMWTLLVAIAVRDVLLYMRSRWYLAAALGVLVAASFASWFPAPSPTFTDPVPQFFRSGAVRDIPNGAVVLVAPVTTGAYNAAPMVWQAESGMWYRSTSGYAFTPGPGGTFLFGPPPSATTDTLDAIRTTGTAPPVTQALREDIHADLSAWKVRAVVVGPMDHENVAVQFLSDVLGTPPQPTGGVYLWRVS